MKELTLKTNGSRECIIFNYWYFFVTNFRFNSEVCNGCHHLNQKSMCFNDVAIVSVKGNDYRIDFRYLSNYEAINLLQNADLIEKKMKHKVLHEFIITY